MSFLVFVLMIVGIIISIFFTFIAGCVFGYMCRVKTGQVRRKATTAEPSSSTLEDQGVAITRGPVYEEIDLEDVTTVIDLSKNIAYESANKI